MKKVLLFLMMILAACSEDNSIMATASENEEAVTVFTTVNAYDTLHTLIIVQDTVSTTVNDYDTVFTTVNAYNTVSTTVNDYDTVFTTVNMYDTVSNTVAKYDTVFTTVNVYDTVSNTVIVYDTVSSSSMILSEEDLSSSSDIILPEENLSSSSRNIFQYSGEDLNPKEFIIDTFSTFSYNNSVYTLITETVSCEYIGLKPVNDIMELKAISSIAFKEANDTTKNYFWFIKSEYGLERYGVLCPDSTLQTLPNVWYTPENCIIKDSGVFYISPAMKKVGAKGSCRWETGRVGGYTCVIKNIDVFDYAVVRACKY